MVLRIVALALLVLGCFVVLRPFLSAVMWAVILAIACWPVYSRLLGWLRGRHTLAAALMTVGTILILLIPFLLIGIGLADEVTRSATTIKQLLESPPTEPPAWVHKVPLVGTHVAEGWREVASDTAWIRSRLREFIEPVSKWLLAVSVHFANGLVDLALSIFIVFFLFRDGIAAAQRFAEATENLAGDEGRKLMELAGRTIRGVVYGILGTALAQSILLGTGLAIAGVPCAGLLALATFLLSVVPLGPPLVYVPAAIWLFCQGSTGWGVFLLCWGLLIVSSVDNFLKPLIIGQGSRLPFILVFLGIMGGASVFGLIGIFLGPTLLAVGFRLLERWKGPLTDASQ